MTSRAKKRKIAREKAKQEERYGSLKRDLARMAAPPQKILVEPAGHEKMSEVLGEFVAPYLHTADDEDTYRTLFTLAASAWNAALMPEEARDEILNEISELSPGSASKRETLRAFLDAQVKRKLEHFAENRRYILRTEVEATPRGYDIRVASSLDGPPAPG